jgi:hypothetical protein
VLVSKYCDHTPLYRQSQIFARHGVDLACSTLAGWVGGACWWLEALHERLAKNVFASNHLFADDTPVPVLDPGRGRTKTGRLWVYAREQRGWGGPEPPAAVYLFAPDRKAERPASHLEHFRGVLHVDGYAGFEQLADNEDVVLAACWSHTRRKFYEVAEATGSPLAAEALRRIGEIYAIEADVRGQSPAHRLAARHSRSKPIVDALRIWLETQLPLAMRRVMHESRCAVQSSALVDGTMLPQQRCIGSVAAHLSIGMTEQRHRQSGVVRGAQGAHGHRQDTVRSVVLGLHQSSSARAELHG